MKPSMSKQIFEDFRKKENAVEDSGLQVYATEPAGAMGGAGPGPDLGDAGLHGEMPIGGDEPPEGEGPELESAAKVAQEVLAELGMAGYEDMAWEDLDDELKDKCRDIARRFLAVIAPEEEPGVQVEPEVAPEVNVAPEEMESAGKGVGEQAGPKEHGGFEVGVKFEILNKGFYLDFMSGFVWEVINVDPVGPGVMVQNTQYNLYPDERDERAFGTREVDFNDLLQLEQSGNLRRVTTSGGVDEGYKVVYEKCKVPAGEKGNPYAICTASVGRDDKKKFKKCVKDVKSKK